MSFEVNLEEQELLADTFERPSAKITRGELLSEALLTACLAAVVVTLALLRPPHGFAVWPALACVAAMLAAMQVRIDTPFGFTVPTQLAFVPLMFAMPVALVPVAVMLALVLAAVPDIVRRELRPSRLLMTPCNAWFSVGPAAVFALARVGPREAGPALLLAALSAQFVVDFVVYTVRSLIARGRTSLSMHLAQSWIYGVDAALTGMGLVVAHDLHAGPLAVLSLLPLLAVLAVLARERHERLTGLLELKNAYHGTALVLGDVVEADDGYTGEHCRSVVQLAMDVAGVLGLNAEQCRNVEFGALLHDVGKIAIPKEIINKPGKLDADEWTVVKTHTLAGQKMLDRVGGFMRDVGLIVRSHHERWDGGGYPDGLAAEEIPLEARIVTCCDAWNAMRTDRSYRKALPHEMALAELRANSGTQFDPRVVDALLQVVAPAATARAKAAGRAAGHSAPRDLNALLPASAQSS
jgi:putative nucleotidyltransferase with HDIG domain